MKPLFFAATALASLATPAAALDLRFIGQQQVTEGTRFGGTVVGGLSGIDYNPATGRYTAISDDRSQFSPARTYDLTLDLTSTSFSAVNFVSTTPLTRPDGTAYPALQIDPESIRRAPNGNLAYTSEGDANALQSPFVRETTADGTFVRDFAIPGKYAPTANNSSGIRQNLAFESLSFSPDGGLLFTATENALNQDGPLATTANGSPSRILRFDATTGAATGEFVYNVDPVVTPAIPANQFTTAGLVEILALSDTEFLSVERSFSVGVGNSIKLFQFSTDGATDVLSLNSLLGQSYTAVGKTLLFDFATLGITLDNIEGVSFGQTLENGNRSLIFVSDNNFTPGQFSQFLAFEVGSAVPEPASWAMLISGFGLIGAATRRRTALRFA